MRNMSEVGPLARRAAKLMKYLYAGKQIEVEGNIYCLKKDGDGAYQSKSIPVNDWTFMEFMALANELDGKDYLNVMNYKG